jgi:hypothetical protein
LVCRFCYFVRYLRLVICDWSFRPQRARAEILD